MENSRKPRRRNKRDGIQSIFERALEEILTRVCVSTGIARDDLQIAVAYSGGLDSSVLLHLTHLFCSANQTSAHALHIHHGLNSAADAWEQHCRAQALVYQMPFESAHLQLDLGEALGIEQAARIARYGQMGKMCRQHGIHVLLTAHHQNDQAETVLLQMVRGAGLPGLSAMPVLQLACKLMGGVAALARPLLLAPRALLEGYAQQMGLSWVEDDSNQDIRFRRNAIRRGVLPALSAEFSDCSTQLARVASHLQSAQNLLQQLAEIDLANCAGEAANGAASQALDLAKLRLLPTERIDNLLRFWLYQHGCSLPSAARLNEIRWQLFEAANDMHPFFEFGSLQLQRSDDQILLYPRPVNESPANVTLQWCGESVIELPQWGGRLHFERSTDLGLAITDLRAQILTIATRTGSERLKLALNQPSKTLKHLFQEHFIPAWRRPRLPLVYLGPRLIFVAEMGMDVRVMNIPSGVVLRWESLVRAPELAHGPVSI